MHIVLNKRTKINVSTNTLTVLWQHWLLLWKEEIGHVHLIDNIQPLNNREFSKISSHRRHLQVCQQVTKINNLFTYKKKKSLELTVCFTRLSNTAT